MSFLPSLSAEPLSPVPPCPPSAASGEPNHSVNDSPPPFHRKSGRDSEYLSRRPHLLHFALLEKIYSDMCPLIDPSVQIPPPPHFLVSTSRLKKLKLPFREERRSRGANPHSPLFSPNFEFKTVRSEGVVWRLPGALSSLCAL